jgi:hypothetical protein
LQGSKNRIISKEQYSAITQVYGNLSNQFLATKTGDYAFLGSDFEELLNQINTNTFEQKKSLQYYQDVAELQKNNASEYDISTYEDWGDDKLRGFLVSMAEINPKEFAKLTKINQENIAGLSLEELKNGVSELNSVITNTSGNAEKLQQVANFDA